MEGGGFEQDSILATMMLAGGGPSIDGEEAARGEEQRVVRAALQALDVLRAVGQGLQIRGCARDTTSTSCSCATHTPVPPCNVV